MNGKRILSLFLCAALAAFSLAPAGAARADSPIWNGTAQAPAVGNGSSASPYQIGTGEQLKWFANQVNAGSTGICAILTANILLNDTSSWTAWATSPPANAWTPIGNDANRYKGVFDAMGYTVSGVYINAASANQGLFGYIGNGGAGTVKNLKLAQSYIKGSYWVGGICGRVCDFGAISNCENGASVVGGASGSEYCVGGIAGEVQTNAQISGCTNTGSVSGRSSVGGIAGINYGTITSCANQGAVNASYSYAGGIVGDNYGAITDSYNNGSVAIPFYSYAGGICGHNSGPLTNVYNASALTNAWPICTLANGGSRMTNVYYAFYGSLPGISVNIGTGGTPTGKTAEQFASGEAAYLLGSAYGQTFGTHALPVLRVQGGAAVYKLTYMNGSAVHAIQYYNEGNAVSAAGVPTPAMEGGAFLDWQGLPVFMPDRDVTVTASSTPSAPVILTESLPEGVVNKAYSAKITATGTAGITYSLAAGALPAGLTLDANTGDIAGTPTEFGSFALTIHAENAYGSNEKSFTLIIKDALTGDGTLGSPYQIWTAAHLIQFAEIVNGTSPSPVVYAVLMADISLNDTSSWESWGTSAPANAWTPIGAGPTTPFTGGFEGNNHTISGLYCNTASHYVGLFGHVAGGTSTSIKNIRLTQSYIKGGEYVGGICGQLSGTAKTIENCYVSAVVTGTNRVGGICGLNGSASVNACGNRVLGCVNEATVTGASNVGGIVGWNLETVGLCRNGGTVQGSVSRLYIGGICGYNQYAVANCYNTGAVSGKTNVGGICGGSFGTPTTYVSITNAYSTGIITAEPPGYVGGVCGSANAKNTLTKCYYLDASAAIGITSNYGIGEATAASAAQLASGETAYLLGAAFGQTLGTDAIPVFRTATPNNAVYKLTYMNGETVHAAQYYNAGNPVSAAGVPTPASPDGAFQKWEALPATMPETDTTVAAVFAENTPPAAKATVPTQSVEAGKNLSFAASDIAEDADGDALIITAIVTGPAPGTATVALAGGTVTITGVAAGTTSVTVTVSDDTDTVDVSVPIEVTAAPLVTHTITATAGTGGSITPSGAVTVNEGDDRTFTIAADAGYEIASVTVDEVVQDPAVSSYTFKGVDADHTISATFRRIAHIITATAGT
ncbi:MAG TPA: GLUG motif-containing protein, partial [Clostridia bacterium]|nr:GLUG motif-containing protein [Clostridia bacterium]